MTDSTTQPAIMPDIARADVRAVFLSHWHVGDAERGRAELGEIMAAWQRATWPTGILTFSSYLSTDNDTALTYAQCTDDAVYSSFVRGLPIGQERAEAVVHYRRRRSVVLDSAAGAPGPMVIASFDVDGPDRQRAIVAAVTANLEQSPAVERTGLIAAHFHVSVDGTRVINYAEWTTDKAHAEFLEGATRYGSLRITNDMPGVRPIGYTRYHLYRGLVRGAR